jgi:hypothetical protein
MLSPVTASDSRLVDGIADMAARKGPPLARNPDRDQGDGAVANRMGVACRLKQTGGYGQIGRKPDHFHRFTRFSGRW